MDEQKGEDGAVILSEYVTDRLALIALLCAYMFYLGWVGYRTRGWWLPARTIYYISVVLCGFGVVYAGATL